MSTSVQFTPSTKAAFSFQPVIDGVQYNAIVTWNVFGQRYYLNLFDTSGNLALCRAVVSSGPRLGITLTWENDGVSGLAIGTTNAPHNIPVGELANVHISQTGTIFDGQRQVLSTSEDTITYALANPDEVQPVSGQLSFNVNLVATLGAGWLLYHYDTQEFEFESTPAAS